MSIEISEQVTQILQQPLPDQASRQRLLALVYEELRRMAESQMSREKAGQSIQPTELVHEAYLRLVGASNLRWENRAHFFGAAARSMRQILINRAQRRAAAKHGGDRKRVELDPDFAGEPEPEIMLSLDVALEQLEKHDSRKSEIVMLRYFAGLSIQDTAQALGISPATVKREWQFARSWLYKEIIRE